MSKNKKIISIIGLVIVLAFSFLIFLGVNPIKKTGVEISAFIFVLITELILYGCAFALASKKQNTFMTAGLSSITFLYTICSLLFNILFVGIFKSVRSILIFNFSILCIYAFVIVLLFLFKKESPSNE